ncbi:MAG: FAD-dependent oxidoreductase [Cyclobacteriaceae bacterium]
MDTASEIDLIIVGQGLAGSAVAMRALALDHRIVVLDDPSQNRSSSIAAGLFNPITGRSMVKTWLADLLFPALFQYYSEVERLTGRKFFHPMPLYRPFATIEEQNEWMGKSSDILYKNYISHLSATPGFKGEVNDPLGGITLKQTGYLDTQTYLEAVRGYLKYRAAFKEQSFDREKLIVRDNFVQYENFTAKKIIFCQGVQNTSNPWFDHIPVTSLKGEFLTVQSDWKKDVILNRGVYMVPGTQLDEWRVGSTYNRNDHLPGITSWARNELTQKLGDIFSMKYTITGQEWGVRPITPDRKPVIGKHPKHNSLIIFNGFGTKGVSLAPYFSEVLIRWVGNKGTIDKEADVTRFN